MRVELHEQFDTGAQDLRSPTERDVEALGELMYRAYLGTIDYEDETLEQSVEEVRKTYRGDYGRFDSEHSSVAERGGLLASATLITRWQDRPFVAFSMTDPRFSRQGLARASLERSMGLLRQDGERELRLVVTLANEPALNLYESLGFRQEGDA
jgi:ribosomal protein S18 acetylase RimI-like enzyme